MRSASAIPGPGTYVRIDLITPANSEALQADLRTRTGLPIKRVVVGRIDFTRDTPEIVIYYDEPKAVVSSAKTGIVTRRFSPRQQNTMERIFDRAEVDSEFLTTK